MNDSWKYLLEPLSEMVAAPMVYIWSTERTTEELEALGVAAVKASNTNCWWATYQAAQLIKVEAPLALLDLDRRREAAESIAGESL